MNAEKKDSIICPECGRQLAETARPCPHCGAAISEVTHEAVNVNEARRAWASEGGRIKRQWVIAVALFWITVAIQVVVYFYQETLNFILISIAGGMMVLGMWLKIRYGIHLRKEPQKPN